jgi:hypothetical protein
MSSTGNSSDELAFFPDLTVLATISAQIARESIAVASDKAASGRHDSSGNRQINVLRTRIGSEGRTVETEGCWVRADDKVPIDWRLVARQRLGTPSLLTEDNAEPSATLSPMLTVLCGATPIAAYFARRL